MELECYLTKGPKSTEILTSSNNPVFLWSVQIQITCSLYLEFGPKNPRYFRLDYGNSHCIIPSRPVPASNQSRLVHLSCDMSYLKWSLHLSLDYVNRSHPQPLGKLTNRNEAQSGSWTLLRGQRAGVRRCRKAEFLSPPQRTKDTL